MTVYHKGDQVSVTLTGFVAKDTTDKGWLEITRLPDDPNDFSARFTMPPQGQATDLPEMTVSIEKRAIPDLPPGTVLRNREGGVLFVVQLGRNEVWGKVEYVRHPWSYVMSPEKFWAQKAASHRLNYKTEDQIGPGSREYVHSPTELRPGDKVKVTFTGIVHPPISTEVRRGEVPVAEERTDRVISVPRRPNGTGYTVQVIETEAYEDGKVYADQLGTLYLYRGDRTINEQAYPWMRLPDGGIFGWELPIRPLRKLTAEGS